MMSEGLFKLLVFVAVCLYIAQQDRCELLEVKPRDGVTNSGEVLPGYYRPGPGH